MAETEAGRTGRLPEVVSAAAHAKVNLRLVVFGREESGFHSLETVFLRTSLCDTVRVERGGAGIQLEVEPLDLEAPEAIPADTDNLCWRAAEAFFGATGARPGARIRLEKRVPSAAGLGGGSADAAAVLAALNQLWDRPLGRAALLELAGTLGSDVPFAQLDVAMALAWERGRRLLPLRPPPPRPGLLLVPETRVASRDAFAWLDAERAERLVSDQPGGAREKRGPPRTAAGASGWDSAGALPGAGRLHDWQTLARIARNDFEATVFDRYPELGEARAALEALGAGVARLSGSGSALFAVFRDPDGRDAAARDPALPAAWRRIPVTIPG